MFSNHSSARKALVKVVLAVTTGTATLHAAMAQELRHYRAGEAPTADEVARMLGGCPSAQDCDGVRTRQLQMKKQGGKSPSGGGFSIPIRFELGSATLSSEAISILDSVASGVTPIFAADASTRIAIEGHADQTGPESFNEVLSLRRASAVRDYLTSRLKLPPQAFPVAGFGSRRPIPGKDPAAAENRRVEFVRR